MAEKQSEGNVKIHVSHLSKSFGKLEVLKDISVDVHEGEVVVVIGPSGSGKSTFLRCLNRLETATGGEITVDGENILDRRTDINHVRQNIGMVFQHFNLFPHMDVLKNLMMAPLELKKDDKERMEQTAMQMLKKVGMDEKAHAYPDQLSGGQQQRSLMSRRPRLTRRWSGRCSRS